MKRKAQGILIKGSVVAGESYMAYVPKPLPPRPAVDMEAVGRQLARANIAIGQLNGVIEANLNPLIINYMYVRKEAVLSSQIEGTQSTLDDLLRYESEQTAGITVDDVAEVSSYVNALNHGLRRVEGGFPLSLRLIREIHKILLHNSRGRTKTPGEFRRSQNWIGGTRPSNALFVPAPAHEVMNCLHSLEQFIHAEDNIPELVKAALIHQQFETIHPFLDGNGRTGRLLITLFLCIKGFLQSPFLYLSLFFKQHRDLYYDKLNAVRKTGNWEDWINFFLEGIAETATDAKNTLLAIKKLFAVDDKKVAALGRAAVSAKKVFAEFQQKPVLTIVELVKRTGLATPTAISAVRRLIVLGILENISEKKWGQLYSYKGYVDLLAPGTGNN
ncbi:cell division protein Fic [Spirochaetia bacterium]|nr:cell division protein Fic [Spirochaetia bacterium]